MDADYVEQLAPWRDWQILLKTPYSVFRQTRALGGFRRLGKASVSFLSPDPQENANASTPLTDC